MPINQRKIVYGFIKKNSDEKKNFLVEIRQRTGDMLTNMIAVTCRKGNYVDIYFHYV